MRLCCYCKNWEFDGGSPGYSEYTPGYDWHMSCEKNHWDYMGASDFITAETFAEIMESAKECTDFEKR